MAALQSQPARPLRAGLARQAPTRAPREESLPADRIDARPSRRSRLKLLLLAPLSLAITIAPGCASTSNGEAGTASGATAASPPGDGPLVPISRLEDRSPARIVWEDFHRRGSRLTLVTPGFDRSGWKLEQGRLEPSTKLVEPEIVDEIEKFMRSEGFFDRATEVDPRAAVSVDAKLKAAITLERGGRRLSIFHVLGSGDSPGGQAAVDSFVTIKKAILAVYNATTQYTGIVERH